MSYKYISVKLAYNGYFLGLEFSANLEDLKSYILKNRKDYRFFEIYNMQGNNVGVVRYNLNDKFFTEAILSFYEDECRKVYKTVDVGDGNLVWEEV